MLTLKIIVLVLCTVIACWASKKIVESILNLISLSYNKSMRSNMKRNGMVYNKNTKKLDADNSLTVPFE